MIFVNNNNNYNVNNSFGDQLLKKAIEQSTSDGWTNRKVFDFIKAECCEYNPNFEQFGHSQGWQCPICKRVYSPTTSMCFYCGNMEVTYSTTTNPHPREIKEWVFEYEGKPFHQFDETLKNTESREEK